MTAELRTLYQDTILDHNRHPRNFRALDGTRHAEGHNPLCGDRLTVFVSLRDGVIEEATFQGFGCAIAVASASLMTEGVKGTTPAEVERLFERVQRMTTSAEGEADRDLGALSALAGVREFPVRAKCALLPWQTLRAALDARDDLVSTE
jgi:nitrogen fixation protein NifU and related proteins